MQDDEALVGRHGEVGHGGDQWNDPVQHGLHAFRRRPVLAREQDEQTAAGQDQGADVEDARRVHGLLRDALSTPTQKAFCRACKDRKTHKQYAFMVHDALRQPW